MADFKSVSLADQVFEKLENDIITGFYPRGEILTELKLVEQLGVSRTPIREALRRLEQERLIADSGKGSIVLGITEEDLLDIMNIRQRIEGLAAYYAAQNMTEEGRQKLTHIVDLQEFYHEKGDADRLQQVDDEFHDMICALSGRTVLMDTLIPLHRKTRRFRRISMQDSNRTAKTKLEHRAIYDALMAGNADQAMELTTQHIANAKDHMIRGLKHNG
ncbi:MAG: GntR family transcriptional regulator [Oscillospiraceae bacterium]|nr:GntR family transcriptional regulator [Oscillospiraceae bacterium]